MMACTKLQWGWLAGGVATCWPLYHEHIAEKWPWVVALVAASALIWGLTRKGVPSHSHRDSVHPGFICALMGGYLVAACYFVFTAVESENYSILWMLAAVPLLVPILYAWVGGAFVVITSCWPAVWLSAMAGFDSISIAFAVASVVCFCILFWDVIDSLRVVG